MFAYRRLLSWLLLWLALWATVEARADHDHPHNAWEMPKSRFVDLEGVERTLDEWAGRVILLNFWATWSRAGELEVAKLVAWNERHAEEGLQVVAIGLDNEEKLRAAVRALKVDYPVLVSRPSSPRLLSMWGNPTGIVPFSVVIDRRGEIVYVQRGLFSQEAFDQKVLPLLGDQPVIRDRQ